MLARYVSIFALLTSAAASVLTFDYHVDNPNPGRCVQATYYPPVSDSEYFRRDAFRQLSHARLAGAVAIPTIIYDDMSDPRDARWQPFRSLHQYLRHAYPRTFAAGEVVTVGGHSLLINLKGSTAAKPIMFTGHMDVVSPGDPDRWRFPPFSAHFDGEWLWGRGSADCKSNVIGLLSVVERLLETGFQFRRTIVLAFGQDEETSGKVGATSLAEVVRSWYGEDGVELILDEGGSGIAEVYGSQFALPALAEKGYVDVRITVRATAGHSSTPPPHTSIGLLAHMIVTLEDAELFRPHIQADSPLDEYVRCLATHGQPHLVPKWLPPLLQEGRLNEIATRLATEDEQLRYLFQTSKAATLVSGGTKVNVLPEESSATFNSRLEISSSVDDHTRRVTAILLPVAERFNVSLTAFGQQVHHGQGASCSLDLGDLSKPSPWTHADSEAWTAVGTAVKATFGPDTVLSPALMTGNTDTKHYWDLTRNIFRWTPVRVGARLNAHNVDERIKLSAHMQAAEFYHGDVSVTLRAYAD